MFDMDMNRIFPGNEHGATAEFVAAGIMKDLAGADLCIDIHSSNIFLRERRSYWNLFTVLINPEKS